jgi:hypothetical protein
MSPFARKQTPAPRPPALTLAFRLYREGVHPLVEFVPGESLGDVNDLHPWERAELVEHVRSILRDRSEREAA